MIYNTIIQIKSHLNIAETRKKLSTLWDFYITDDEYTDKPFLNSVWHINEWNNFDKFISIFLNSNWLELHLKTSDWKKIIDKYKDIISEAINK